MSHCPLKTQNSGPWPVWPPLGPYEKDSSLGHVGGEAQVQPATVQGLPLSCLFQLAFCPLSKGMAGWTGCLERSDEV